MQELLLLKDVRKLGHVGDVVKVRDGYARNFLLPQRLATAPTEENIRAIETVKRAASAERARRTKEFQEVATKMADLSVTIEANANPEGTLYGSVGPREIAVACQAQGFPVLAEHVMLEPPIRTLDNRNVRIEFTEDVEVTIKVWVVREGSLPEQPAADAAPAEAAEAQK